MKKTKHKITTTPQPPINSEKTNTKEINYKTTAEIKIPKTISEQIIGQDEGLKIIKKAAKQRRNILLIGEPGTGKSLLGQALAEQIPQTKVPDILCFPNEQDENNPLIRIMPKGKGRDLIARLKIQASTSSRNLNIILFIVLIITLITPWWIRKEYGDIIAAASIIGSMIFFMAFLIFINLNKRFSVQKIKTPKLLVTNSDQHIAPFIDATGAKSGALLGDVLHDPLQCFPPTIQIQQKNRNIPINKFVNSILNKHKYTIIKQGSYLAVHSKKGEFSIVGEQNNSIFEAEVLSANKHKYKGNLIKLTTESGKELIVTSEHKVAIKSLFNKIKYIRADKLNFWHKVIILE